MLTASQVTHAPQRWRAAGAMNFPDFWATCTRHREANHPISIEVFIALCWEETFCSNMAQGGKPIALGPGQLQVSEDEKVYYFAGLDIVDQKTPRENFLGTRWDTSLTTWAVGKDLKVSLRSASILPASLGLKPMTKDDVLGNNDFAIKMHWRYFDWLRNGNGRNQASISSANGLLDAQTGGNKTANQAFLDGGSAIREAMNRNLPFTEILSMNDKDRKDYIQKRRADMAAGIQAGGIAFRGKSAAAGVKFFPQFWEFFLPDEYFTEYGRPQ